MPYNVEIKEVEPQRMASIRASTRPEEIGTTLEEILPAVWMHLRSHGIRPAGPPFTRYCDVGEERVGLEAGFPITDPLEGDERVVVGELPGGRVAVTWHVGPFDRLREAYQALDAWLRHEGCEPAGPPWEVYWTDPEEEPDPDRLTTEIILPIS
jgi:effector-binding domain-containing protein